jgi:hypothetical protein
MEAFLETKRLSLRRFTADDVARDGEGGLKYVRTFHLEWPEEIEGTAEGDVEYAITRADWGP